MTPVPWKLWEGQVVDVYFPLRRYLGGAGRSAVYLTQFGEPEPRSAAIKLVLAETQDVDPAAQWERAARLSHPNLLRLLRTGTWQMNQRALRYAVTEYAEENLAEVLAERPLTAAEVREILKPLLGALAYIHSEGLVHGHVKPGNILAVGDELKLSVDGISLVGEPGPAPAIPGPYDPPEFRERGCSPVGDVWSFGVTLVEALTRQLPASGGSSKQDLALPETLPAEFVPLVRACLQPDPRRRATVNDILELFERKEPSAAPRPKTLEEPLAEITEPPNPEPPAASRRWLSLVLVSAAALLLAGILAGLRLFRHPAASAQTQATVAAPLPPAATVAPRPAQSSGEPAQGVAERAKPTPFPPPAALPSPPKTPGTHTAEKSVEAASGQILHQVLPQAPEYALRTIHGKVKIQVRVAVDASGNVTDASVESENSRYFAKLALSAARQWEFANGPADWLLRFEFVPSGTTVHPSRVTQ
jgi:serine/threonine-protein kinase Stk1